MAEFAIVLPVLLIILLAVFDVGRLVFAYNDITNAARNGARVAIVDQTANKARDTAISSAGLGLKNSQVQVTYLTDDLSGTCPSPYELGVASPRSPSVRLAGDYPADRQHPRARSPSRPRPRCPSSGSSRDQPQPHRGTPADIRSTSTHDPNTQDPRGRAGARDHGDRHRRGDRGRRADHRWRQRVGPAADLPERQRRVRRGRRRGARELPVQCRRAGERLGRRESTRRCSTPPIATGSTSRPRTTPTSAGRCCAPMAPRPPAAADAALVGGGTPADQQPHQPATARAASSALSPVSR